MKTYLCMALTLFAVACAGVHPNPGADTVRIIKNIAAVKDCAFIGTVKPRGNWIGRDQRNIQLQNAAHLLDADTVLVLDKAVMTADEGRAYRCRK